MKLEVPHESANTAQMPGSAVVSCRHFTGRFHRHGGNKQLANALVTRKAASSTCVPLHISHAHCNNQDCICLKACRKGYYIL